MLCSLSVFLMLLGCLTAVHIGRTGNRISVTTPRLLNKAIKIRPTESQENLCPEFCTCQEYNNTISCSGDFRNFSFKNISLSWKLKSLHLFGGLTEIPEELKNHPDLVVLNLSNNKIRSVSKTAFERNLHLSVLDLSGNEISILSAEAFEHLENLTVLNLKRNKIEDLPEGIFSENVWLQTLDLSSNLIGDISSNMFSNLAQLQVLNLNSNKLKHIQAFTFLRMSSMQELDLSNNKILSISSEDVEEFRNFTSIDLSRNPLDCSCALYSVFRLQKISSVLFKNKDRYICDRPNQYSGINIFSLTEETLPCVPPEISHISDAMDVTYMTRAQLTCKVTGHPEPFVYWITPWGQAFTQKNQFHLLKGKNMTLKSHASYFGVPFFTSDIYISDQNSLYLQNFRGGFAGQFVCVGVNSMGEVNGTVEVNITSKFYSVYLRSNFIGGVCAGGMLCLGIFTGLMKLCLKKICNCNCCEDEDEDALKEFSKVEITVESESGNESPTSTLRSDDYYYDDDFTPTTPLNSPFGRTPRASPMKCVTPTESPEKWRNSKVLDTLDEVKYRLERRMDKVRGHVKAIRSSGSQYIQTIKETGSSAVGRVRAGMVIGVEQMKYGYQSIREFCGTGEMGNQTISMISVSTDVDTNVKSTVVRNVTQV